MGKACQMVGITQEEARIAECALNLSSQLGKR